MAIECMNHALPQRDPDEVDLLVHTRFSARSWRYDAAERGSTRHGLTGGPCLIDRRFLLSSDLFVQNVVLQNFENRRMHYYMSSRDASVVFGGAGAPSITG